MPRPDNPQIVGPISVSFAGGLNTRQSETVIDPRECAAGENFSLDIDKTEFNRRRPFDLRGTAPNGARVSGMAQLRTTSDQLTTLIQAGTIVYLWDGGSGFTQVGTVAAGTKMRGYRRQIWGLDNEVIITDVSLRQPVMKWNGTSFRKLAHNLTGDFFAAYCTVDEDRALYARCFNQVALPAVVVGSELENFENLSVSDRPSSSLNEADPFFLTVPDLRPVNGMITAFASTVFSSQGGQIHILDGSSAKDYAMRDLYGDSGADGEEPIVFIGNDVAYGRQGKIESLISTDRLGDVATDDLSRQIRDDVRDGQNWLAAYSARQSRVYFFQRDRSKIFVYHKDFVDERLRQIQQDRPVAPLSPWSVWTTQHPSAFQTDVCMPLLDPTTGLEEVFWGGSNGEIFMMNGTGGQDGGTADIRARRTSAVIRAQLPDASVFDITGEVRYRKIFPGTLKLTYKFGGKSLRDQEITVDLPGAENLPVYGGGSYYGAGGPSNTYYGSPFSGRFSMQPFNIGASPASNEFQIEAEVEGSSDFFIEEIITYFRAL